MRNIILSFIIFSQLTISSFASCYTGFACNLDDLNQQVELQNNMNLISDYFDKKVIEPNYITKLNNFVLYNDLFVFNTIV